MKREDINAFIAKNQKLTRKELAVKCGISLRAVVQREQNLGIKRTWKHPDAVKTLQGERQKAAKDSEVKDTKRLLKESIREYSALEKRLDAMLAIKKGTKIHKIVPYKATTESEATAICLASDWHIEEAVDSAKTNGLNEYSLDISKSRATQFFQRLVKLVKKEQQDVRIDNLVLALLGDFITGNIHEELPALCAVPPTQAILIAQSYIASGIQYVLDNSELKLTIVCTCGNHARITHKVHWGNEQGNSLEYMMYHNLRNVFARETRVKFVISEAYHCHVYVYDKCIRFHHGHAIKFLGGIGGITVPVNNKIYRWSKNPQKVDMDCMGHFHQLTDGGSFIINGSMIGYSNMGALYGGYERPQQSLFLIDKARGKTVHIPILFDV